MHIIQPSTQMKESPNENSALETECLFGEKIEIKDSYMEWVYCKSETDNYSGWIKKNTIGALGNPTHRVIANRSFIYERKDAKSNCLFYLPMGAKLVIKDIQATWAKVSLFTNYDHENGYIPSNHIIKLNHSVEDWVAIAENLINTPYRWGGKDTIGIDCSALLQLSYENYGEIIPRNTIDQLKVQKPTVSDINALRRGFVVFWKGHVAIMTDKLNCVHANAFHMKTIIEPLDEVVSRMNKENKIFKIFNFN